MEEATFYFIVKKIHSKKTLNDRLQKHVGSYKTIVEFF